jgi:hypothetical protein
VRALPLVRGVRRASSRLAAAGQDSPAHGAPPPAQPAVDDLEAMLWSALRRALHGPLMAGLGLGTAS